jgi:uncharacterized protein (DUF952 family)
VIYHLTSDPACLEPESLKSEGFVHCSTAEQLLATAERYFSHLEEVHVLELDTAKLGAELLCEQPAGPLSPKELFPHLYGPIEARAVVRVCRLIRQDGCFTWADGGVPREEGAAS